MPASSSEAGTEHSEEDPRKTVPLVNSVPQKQLTMEEVYERDVKEL